MSPTFSRPDTDLETDIIDEVKEPRKFRVLLHNDDYTTMDFVIMILMNVFHKNKAEATRIMLSVHEKGVGECGVFPAEVAETKVELVHSLARKEGFPLRSSMEEV